MYDYERRTGVEINGQYFAFHSIPTSRYVQLTDQYILSNPRDTVGYMDALFRETITQPEEIRTIGIAYFDQRHDTNTAISLSQHIDAFLTEKVTFHTKDENRR